MVGRMCFGKMNISLFLGEFKCINLVAMLDNCKMVLPLKCNVNIVSFVFQNSKSAQGLVGLKNLGNTVSTAAIYKSNYICLETESLAIVASYSSLQWGEKLTLNSHNPVGVTLIAVC